MPEIFLPKTRFLSINPHYMMEFFGLQNPAETTRNTIPGIVGRSHEKSSKKNVEKALFLSVNPQYMRTLFELQNRPRTTRETISGIIGKSFGKSSTKSLQKALFSSANRHYMRTFFLTPESVQTDPKQNSRKRWKVT